MEISNVVDTIRSWKCTAMAGRSTRALADRAVDPLCEQRPVHTEADLAKIAASIDKWGWTMPVLADEDGVLIAGHLRISAAIKLAVELGSGGGRTRLERGGEAGLIG